MKPALIILHGALGSKDQFISWTESLSGKFTCYTPEFTGHGASSGEEVEFSIERFSEELIGFIHQNDLVSPAVLGYSMGGYVALSTALHQPGALGKIMTLATKFEWTPDSAKKEAGYLDPVLMQQKVPQLAQQLAQRHGTNWQKVVERTAHMMLKLGNAPPVTEQTISLIQNELRLCVGDKDKMVGINETQRMYLHAKKASFCVMPQTAHLPETMDLKRINFEAEAFFLS